MNPQDFQAYRLDEQTLLVPRRVRIGPDDPEWERWQAVAVPVPASWGEKVRPLFLRPGGQRGRVGVLPEPKPEPPPPPESPEPASVAPAAPLPTDRLTPAEVATMVRHTEQTVIRWCRCGVLTPAMIGRRVFVLRSEVDRFLRHGPAVKPLRRRRDAKRRKGTLRKTG